MRLIDADALDWECIEQEHGARDETVVDCEIMIETAPTIDAVSIVRCKDCKHFRTFRTSSDGEEIRACVGKGIVDLNYDDFCSKGERKDNG